MKTGLTLGSPCAPACGVRHADAARHAGHMAEDGLGVSHQLRFDAIADADPRQLGLLEVPVDPIAVGVDDRDIGAPLMGKIADPHQEVGDIAVDRAANLGAAAD